MSRAQKKANAYGVGKASRAIELMAVAVVEQHHLAALALEQEERVE